MECEMRLEYRKGESPSVQSAVLSHTTRDTISLRKVHNTHGTFYYVKGKSDNLNEWKLEQACIHFFWTLHRSRKWVNF